MNPDGVACNSHLDCESEYCDKLSGVCTARKKVGETCDLKNECEMYICDNGKCSDSPQIKVQPTPIITNDHGKECLAEINYPPEDKKKLAGPLSKCNKNNAPDKSKCYYDNNICQDNRCRIKT